MIPTEAVSSAVLNDLLFYFVVMGLLLVAATFLRIKFRIFRRYFIPASLIAGFLGLILGPYGIYCFCANVNWNENRKADWHNQIGSKASSI